MVLKRHLAGYEETDKKIVVRFEIPEAVRDHLRVAVTDSKLFVQLDKKEHSNHAGYDSIKEEGTFTAFSREMLLPSKVNPKKTKTSYKNGIFQVIMEKF